MLKRIVDYAKKLKRVVTLETIADCKTLMDIALYVIKKQRLKQLSILEIGVFKGDNAKELVLDILKYSGIKITYFGFDLFDDIDYLQDKYPDDYKQYNTEEYPYWEFNSGGHSYLKVLDKLSTVMEREQFKLFKGDTIKTLPEFVNNELASIDLVYIDGCHDYDVVKSDWLNCSMLYKNNPKLIILFDDYTYEGVKMVYDEIVEEGEYQTLEINYNQFIVFLNDTI